MRRLTLLILLFGPFSLLAADTFHNNGAIDIKHYRFQIELNDSTDIIAGKATITILFNQGVSEFEFDLVNKNIQGLGMQVNQITFQERPVKFIHQNDRVKVMLPTAAVPGSYLQFIVDYGGVPQDGLIISKNKFGDRTFFGDNWPNRARHWLPSVDHSSDKATCEFIVTAPAHYQVVANGKKVKENKLEKNQKQTHWKETIEIPVKVMVFGAARFDIEEAGRVGDIAVESWVYPQDRTAGFSDFKIAVKILDFFDHHIGPYPYEKLANVESKTRFGGMENASNIFYAESLVDGKKNHDELIAHEIAHQWFGNSATENDWPHLWLSEGFATYFSHLYMESVYGHDRLVEEVTADRFQVVNYSRTNPAPVIDTVATDLMKLLNPNSYQKGSWVLHMLRHEVGDVIFWKGIQNYYQRYRNTNALTADFKRTMEDASGKDLSMFFDQWLKKSGHPIISGFWEYNPKTKSVTVNLSQVQTGTPFNVPLDIGFQWQDGGSSIHTVLLDRNIREYIFSAENRPQQLVLDPHTWLLFEGGIDAR